MVDSVNRVFIHGLNEFINVISASFKLCLREINVVCIVLQVHRDNIPY